MLSVCIPIYNRGVSSLISELNVQRGDLSEKIEILCLDDGSDKEHRQLNSGIVSVVDVYVALEQNIGRAAIRNLFLKYAQYDYLLFLDADSLILKKDFLKTYIEKLKLSKIDVVYGGRVYPTDFEEKNRQLRYKYGILRESKSLVNRLKNPYISFQTNNFVLRKGVLQNNQFNENLKQYGHEDTLFAIMLKRKGYELVHIENEVLNDDIETNAEFLEKTEAGIRNLIILKHYLSPTELLEIQLFRVFYRFQLFIFLLKPIYRILHSIFKYYLLHFNCCSVKVFSLYKLIYLAELESSEIKKS